MMDRLRNVFSSTIGMTFTGSYIEQRYRQVEKIRIRKGRDQSIKRWIILFVSVLMDLALGMVLSHLVTSHTTGRREKMVRTSLEWLDTSLVSSLRRLITWLMGAPAGLKLNSVLSGALGRFFLYHIHLWVTFIYLTAPIMSDVLSRVTWALPYSGICLQLSLAQDTFNVVTFHVHCFYAYARRLFLSQTSGLTV